MFIYIHDVCILTSMRENLNYEIYFETKITQYTVVFIYTHDVCI